MLGGFLVLLWLIIGLRVISAGGAWQLGWGGAIFVGLLLWPTFAAGYFSLKRLLFSSPQDREDEALESSWYALLGAPLLVVRFAASLIMLGLMRALDSFHTLPRGGVLNLMMSVIALHLLAWCAAGATHWALAGWRERDD